MFVKKIYMRFLVLFFCLIPILSLSALEIKVLTLNVLNSVAHGGWNEYGWSKSDYKTRGQKTVDVILQSDADIICIQEYIHNNEWIKDELERTTGATWYIRILPRNCAIVSKKPILMHGNMFITPIQLSKEKIINVISSHQFVYTYLPHDIYNGMKVEEACKKAIELNQNAYWKGIIEETNTAIGNSEPVIITGDFNEPSHFDYTPKAVEKGLVKGCGLKGLMSNVLIDEMQMKDIWVEKRIVENKDECSLRGFTWSPTTWDYRKGVDDQRIDFIYYTPNDFKYVDAKLVGEKPKIEIDGDFVDIQFDDWPSDHRGILGVLEIK